MDITEQLSKEALTVVNELTLSELTDELTLSEAPRLQSMPTVVGDNCGISITFSSTYDAQRKHWVRW